MNSGEDRLRVELCTDPLPLEELHRWASRPSCGAVVIFTGITRESGPEGVSVSALEYEAWQEMALERMKGIALDALERWPELGAVAVVHRLGMVPLGEASVACVASSPHRGEALDAARFLIDEVKVRVPIWKKELFEGGARWVEGTAIQPARRGSSVSAEDR